MWYRAPELVASKRDMGQDRLNLLRPTQKTPNDPRTHLQSERSGLPEPPNLAHRGIQFWRTGEPHKLD